jgi:cysteine desulfurase/selenocysteine lyase
VLNVGIAALEALSQDGSISSHELHENHWEPTKDLFRKIISSPKAEIALLPNFSFGINALAASLPAHSKVLLFRNDYPGLLLAFKSKDLDVFWIDPDENGAFDSHSIKSLISENDIDVLAISHVQYMTGQTLELQDLAQFCGDRNVDFIVDCTQSIGHLKVHMHPGVSAILTSGYKWLNAGYGNGAMAVASEFLTKNPPSIAGYGSTTRQDDGWIYEPGIRSYEPGHIAVDKLAMLHEALLIQNEKGIERISDASLVLANHCWKQLLQRNLVSEEEIESLSGSAIVTYAASQMHFEALANQGIVCTFNADRIRVGFHYENSIKEMEQFLAVIDSI